MPITPAVTGPELTPTRNMQPPAVDRVDRLVVADPQRELGDRVRVIRSRARHARRGHVRVAHRLDLLEAELPTNASKQENTSSSSSTSWAGESDADIGVKSTTSAKSTDAESMSWRSCPLRPSCAPRSRRAGSRGAGRRTAAGTGRAGRTKYASTAQHEDRRRDEVERGVGGGVRRARRSGRRSRGSRRRRRRTRRKRRSTRSPPAGRSRSWPRARGRTRRSRRGPRGTARRTSRSRRAG